MGSRWRTVGRDVGRLAIALGALWPAAAPARQTASVTDEVRGVVEQAFGVSSFSATTVGAAAFLPRNSQHGYVNVSNHYRSGAGAGIDTIIFDAPLHLPSGVTPLVAWFEVCDFSTTGKLWAQLLACPNDNAACTTTTVLFDTGVGDEPGCYRDAVAITEPGLITNGTHSYTLRIADTDRTIETRFGALTVFWMRNLSPADGTANYVDVPLGDARRSYVEALTASGIAANCGTARFCPDDPLTRAQLAIFLAKALGL